jgi:hypothetical protein
MHPSTTTCARCGQSLPDGARFCDQCGASQQTTTPAPGPPGWWEYCEITSTSTGSSHAFVAIITAPTGRAVVDTVSKMPHDDPSKTNQLFLAQLVNRLTAAGWEPQPKGSEWYAQRFRRHLIP